VRDDVFSWGEVLRLSGAGGNGLTEEALFTVDMAAHTVTAAVAKTTMAMKQILPRLR
jgi:hypothetical protein